MDSSIIILIGFIVSALIAINIGTRELCKKEFSILHMKLNTIMKENNISYPNECVVPKKVNGLILSNKDTSAIKVLCDETGCTNDEAIIYINNIKENILTNDPLK